MRKNPQRGLNRGGGPATVAPDDQIYATRFSAFLSTGFACAIRRPKIAQAGASLLRSTGRPAASSYRPADGHGHAALKALRSRETTGVCRKKSLWSGNSAIALRMWRMPTSTICAAVGWGEVG
jgi:hypothetical protein